MATSTNHCPLSWVFVCEMKSGAQWLGVFSKYFLNNCPVQRFQAFNVKITQSGNLASNQMQHRTTRTNQWATELVKQKLWALDHQTMAVWHRTRDLTRYRRKPNGKHPSNKYIRNQQKMALIACVKPEEVDEDEERGAEAVKSPWRRGGCLQAHPRRPPNRSKNARLLRWTGGAERQSGRH